MDELPREIEVLTARIAALESENAELVRHRFERLVFLAEIDDPADNNTGERDIRSDGGGPQR